jgi:cytochrome b involved in lipid metabolism
MKKIFFIIVVLLVFGGFYFYKNNSSYDNLNNKNDLAEVESEDAGILPTSSADKVFTMADLSSHSSRESCYSVVNGLVYDLTNFIDKHPGGEKPVLSICGKDGSSLFNGKHGGQMKPEQELAKMKLGVLAK